MTAVAVKVTLVPEQMVLSASLELMLTLAGKFPLILIVMLLELAVVGDAHDVETTLDHGLFDLVGCGGAVTTPHRVRVQVDTNPPRSPRCGEVRVSLQRSRRRFRHPTP